MFCYVWSYRAHPDRTAAFEAAYGPGGDWVRLFRRDPAYIGTRLLRDCDDPLRFMTIDSWTNRLSCLEFRERFAAEYAALDRECDGFTEYELHLGDFEAPDAEITR